MTTPSETKQEKHQYDSSFIDTCSSKERSKDRAHFVVKAKLAFRHE